MSTAALRLHGPGSRPLAGLPIIGYVEICWVRAGLGPDSPLRRDP